MITYKKVLFSVVSYNNCAEIVSFIEMLERQTIKECIDLVITCNYPGDYEKLVKHLENRLINVSIVDPKSNLGYLNGCLYGVKTIQEYNQYTWIFVSNTDIVLADDYLIERLLQTQFEENVCCVAPDIILPSKKKQNPFLINRLSSTRVKTLFYIHSNWQLLRMYTLISKLKDRSKQKSNSKIFDNIIYASHGSVLVLKPRIISIALQSSNDIFMYGEEIYIAELIRLNQGVTKYVPELVIRHNENSTTSLSSIKKKSEWYKQSYGFIIHEFYQ